VLRRDGQTARARSKGSPGSFNKLSVAAVEGSEQRTGGRDRVGSGKRGTGTESEAASVKSGAERGKRHN
jgi:hypothetical protein